MSEQNTQPVQPPPSAQMFQFILGLMIPPKTTESASFTTYPGCYSAE
jgi:hypothetical protein